jgi:hypothetical protein
MDSLTRASEQYVNTSFLTQLLRFGIHYWSLRTDNIHSPTADEEQGQYGYCAVQESFKYLNDLRKSCSNTL